MIINHCSYIWGKHVLVPTQTTYTYFENGFFNSSFIPDDFDQSLQNTIDLGVINMSDQVFMELPQVYPEYFRDGKIMRIHRAYSSSLLGDDSYTIEDSCITTDHTYKYEYGQGGEIEHCLLLPIKDFIYESASHNLWSFNMRLKYFSEDTFSATYEPTFYFNIYEIQNGLLYRKVHSGYRRRNCNRYVVFTERSLDDELYNTAEYLVIGTSYYQNSMNENKYVKLQIDKIWADCFD